ncbi:MAG: hypothetical protein ACOYZ7_10205 [Chloroflexota bacterium]
MGDQILNFVRSNALLLILLLVLLAVFIVFRSKSTQLASLAEFDALTAAGQPVVVEFFSNT